MMSNLERVRYINLPIMLLYRPRSPSDVVNFKPGSMAIEAGFALRNPVLSRRDSAYFLWDKDIPLEDLAISSPKKYFKSLRILSLKRDFLH